MLSRFAFDFLSAVILGITAAIGAYTPVYLAQQDRLRGGTGRSFTYVLGNLFSAGVMVSAGFCHLLGEALKQMPKMQFPLAPFLCGTGYLLTLCADKFASSMSGLNACHGAETREAPVEVLAGLDLAERGTPKTLRLGSRDLSKDLPTGIEEQSSLLGRARPNSVPLASHGSSSSNGSRPGSALRSSSAGLGMGNGTSPALAAQQQQQQLTRNTNTITPIPFDIDSTVVKATSPSIVSGTAVASTHRAPTTVGQGGTLLLRGNSGMLDLDSGPPTGNLHHQMGHNLNLSSNSLHGHDYSNGPVNHHHNVAKQVSFLTAVLMGVALCFHSLLEGAAMGAQSTISNSLHIFIAIVSHKGLAAYALGSSIVDSDAEMKSFWSVIIPFTLASPVGIFIGFIVSDIAQGVGAASISALASGTFLYVAFMEVIPKELQNSSRIGMKLGALMSGFILMSILAIWA